MNGSIEGISFDIKNISNENDKANYDVTIRVPLKMGWIDFVRFTVENSKERKVFSLNHQKNDDTYAYFSSTIELETWALYHYYFSFDINHVFHYFKKKNNTTNQSITDDEKWKLSVNFDTPDWAKGKMMYHVFVDRFNKSKDSKLEPMKNRTIHENWNEDIIIGPNENGLWCTDFYGGNIKGIIEKLDYIKSFGTSIIYLSPIMMSQSNHRYDTSDYEMVDPYAGTNEELKQLCDEAHKRDMKIILDAVFNHTGNDSKYFNEYGNFKELGAYQSSESKYYNFYRKHFYNNQTYFDYWWGMPNLPVCDSNSKEWQEYIYGKDGVIDKWFHLGIDGLRLDVADELSDDFIMNIRKAVKRNKEDGFIIGEVWENAMRKNRGYVENGKCMDSVMNYVLTDAFIRYLKYADSSSLHEVTRQIMTEYPDPTIFTLMNFTSTHDLSRAINFFAVNEFKRYDGWAWDLYGDDRLYQKNFKLTKEQYEYGKKVYMSYIYMLTFYPGILSIFYGDEVGLEGLGNLANRRTYPWGREDKELLEFFRKIGQIRNTESFLETADLNIYDINNDYLLFERSNTDDEALIVVNRSDNMINTPIPEKYRNGIELYPLGNSNNRNIDSHGGLVLKKK